MEKVEAIKQKMKQEGFIAEADEILQSQLSLRTPVEVFASVSFYLNTFRKNKSPTTGLQKKK